MRLKAEKHTLLLPHFHVLKSHLHTFIQAPLPCQKCIFIRHGQTEGNEHKLMYGQTDIGLTELGKLQSMLLKPHISEFLPKCRLYSSDLKRCKETAQLSMDTQIYHRVHFDQRLREINFGNDEGRSFVNVHRDEYDFIFGRAYQANGGESWFDVYDRVRAFLNQQGEINGVMLMYTHCGLIRTLLYDFDVKTDMTNCCVVAFDIQSFKIDFHWQFPSLEGLVEKSSV